MQSTTKIKVKVTKDKKLSEMGTKKITTPVLVQNNGNTTRGGVVSQNETEKKGNFFDQALVSIKTSPLGIDTTITEVMSASSHSTNTKAQIDKVINKIEFEKEPQSDSTSEKRESSSGQTDSS